jgi:branched-subunit amino acid transport protein
MEIWGLVAAIGVGTYLIRFSFLGALGGREIPGWAQRLLRYTPVAVIPGLVAPLVVWPKATGGDPDPARIIAALVTLGVGLWTKSFFAAFLAGGAALYLSLSIL